MVIITQPWFFSALTKIDSEMNILAFVEVDLLQDPVHDGGVVAHFDPGQRKVFRVFALDLVHAFLGDAGRKAESC